jgi:CheY-like chemotaxis protein
MNKMGPEANKKEKPKVLVVEDLQDLRDVIASIASLFGLESETAENGQVACEKVRQGEFDLVLMDLQMPVMDGFAALKTIRAEGFTMPVVAVTAHVSRSDRENCLAAGFTDFLAKPFTEEEIRRVFAYAFQERERKTHLSWRNGAGLA